jgi:integrase
VSRRFARLSRDAVKRLRDGQKINEGGVTAARLADGDVRWSVNVMVAGRRIHRVIGRESDGVSRSDCEVFIERARTEEREGRLHLPAGRKTYLTFEQVARRYLDRMEQGGGRNLKNKRPQIEQRLIPYFGRQRADTLTEFTINTYKRRRLEEGAAVGSVNRDLATLKHMLRDAVKAKDIAAVPCSFALFPEPPGRTTVLSDAECDALLAAAVADQDPDLWLFVAFGLNTAMRHREILRARFDQIDWSRRRLHIPQAKAGAREQPLTPVLVELLKQERTQRGGDSGFIFRARQGREAGHRTQMSKPFERAVRRANLDHKRVTPHVMRHTAITRLVQAGIDLPTIQQISGHKTLAMVLRYAHVSGGHIDAAMAALDRTIPERRGSKKNSESTQLTPQLHTRPETPTRPRALSG